MRTLNSIVFEVASGLRVARFVKIELVAIDKIAVVKDQFQRILSRL